MGSPKQIKKNEPDNQRVSDVNINGDLMIYNFEDDSIQKNENEI